MIHWLYCRDTYPLRCFISYILVIHIPNPIRIPPSTPAAVLTVTHCSALRTGAPIVSRCVRRVMPRASATIPDHIAPIRTSARQRGAYR